jgi:hypothetical protein
MVYYLFIKVCHWTLLSQFKLYHPTVPTKGLLKLWFHCLVYPVMLHYDHSITALLLCICNATDFQTASHKHLCGQLMA